MTWYAEYSTDFTIAEDPLSYGGKWVKPSTQTYYCRAYGGTIVPQNTREYLIASYTVAAASDNNYAQVYVGASPLDYVGVFGRGDSPEAANVYLGNTHARGYDYQKIYKVVNGVWTLFGPGAQLSYLATTMRVEIIGNIIKLLRNGITQLTITDSTHATGKYTGVWLNNNATPLDDFEMGSDTSTAAIWLKQGYWWNRNYGGVG